LKTPDMSAYYSLLPVKETQIRFPLRACCQLQYGPQVERLEETEMLKPQLTEFMRRMDPNSVAIIPAAREAVRSHDTNYRYRQNSDFFYLTGFEEPDAIAVIAPS